MTKQPCDNMCSVCAGESILFTGPIRRNNLISVLCSALQMSQSPATAISLKAAITKRKKDIFVKPVKSAGQIHALLLQLYANGIIKFYIKDTNLIGTNKLSSQHILLQLVYGKDNNGICKPAYDMNDCWTGINIE